jgi:hypothetical protein
MKTRKTVTSKIRRWLSFVILTIQFISVSAQSGRKIQEPQPTPTPQSSPKQLDVKSKLVIDPNAGKYKLIFLTSYERKRVYYKEGKETDAALQKNRNNFIELLNKAGSQGYRLISFLGSLVCIVKIDEIQYEYAWFETDTNLFFAKVGFEEKYARMTKQGFRLVEHTLISHICEIDVLGDFPSLMETCEINDLFLLEKEKDVDSAIPYSLVSYTPKWGGKRSLEIATAIKENLTKGFYPTRLFSEYEIFLEQIEKRDEGLTNKVDLQVVRGATALRRDKLEKEVNELAKQGYRLALNSNKIALMIRDAENKTPVTYVWLDTKKKSFDKDLAKLQESGAVYWSTYPNDQGVKNKLIFVQPSVNGGTRREYKVLRFEFEDMENVAEKKVYTDLTPSSKETVKEMNRLVKEGFVVRDLFVSDKVSVLLERSR